MCYSLLVLKKDALFIIKTVSNKNCFFSRLEGYIHILHDEAESGVTKKFQTDPTLAQNGLPRSSF